MTTQEIIEYLPYTEPFLFVEDIDTISDNGCTGYFTFKKSAFFYEGHFKKTPITPGVILTECMAQIGLVCLGIYLLRERKALFHNLKIALTSHQMDFFIPVLPDETVKVTSEKQIFRFNKLKCQVKMFNSKDELVARGHISGMIKV